MTAGPEQRWFFVHLHKTAGTALLQRLRIALGDDAVYPTASDNWTYFATMNLDLLRRRFAEQGDRIRVITGHFPLCTTALLGAPFTTLTVLRDPVERTLSALRDMRERDAEHRDKPLDEIYADPVKFRCLIQNHMVKMLALTPEEMTDGFLTVLDLDTTHLERAKRNLADRIDVWGVQEHFEEFCDELTRRFGWDLGPPRFANRSTQYEAQDGLAERIAEDNRLDIELYRFALELREQRSPAPSI
jgi:hypothetical protein